MHDQLYIEYIQKDLLGTISSTEKNELEKWKSENETMAESLYKAWEMSGEFGSDIEIDVEGDYQKLISKREGDQPSKRIFRLNAKSLLGIAAALLTLVVVSYFFLQPGANEGKWLEVVAESNRQEVILADGTKVVLAKDAKIVYPRDFEGSRNIHIDGAAYLEVVHNPDVPFEIVSPHLITTVLGTTFLIIDLSDDHEAEVQLIEGKVKVTNRLDNLTVELFEKQSARFRLDRLMKFNAVYDEQYNWYFGSLQFKNTEFSEVVSRLEKRFEFTLIFNEELGVCRFSGDLEKRNLNEILTSLATAVGGELRDRGNTFEMVGGSCTIQ